MEQVVKADRQTSTVAVVLMYARCEGDDQRPCVDHACNLSNVEYTYALRLLPITSQSFGISHTLRRSIKARNAHSPYQSNPADIHLQLPYKAPSSSVYPVCPRLNASTKQEQTNPPQISSSHHRSCSLTPPSQKTPPPSCPRHPRPNQPHAGSTNASPNDHPS